MLNMYLKKIRKYSRSVGIDHFIYPEELAAFELVKLIQRAAATDIIEFEDGKLSLVGLKLRSKTSSY